MCALLRRGRPSTLIRRQRPGGVPVCSTRCPMLRWRSRVTSHAMATTSGGSCHDSCVCIASFGAGSTPLVDGHAVLRGTCVAENTHVHRHTRINTATATATIHSHNHSNADGKRRQHQQKRGQHNQPTAAPAVCKHSDCDGSAYVLDAKRKRGNMNRCRRQLHSRMWHTASSKRSAAHSSHSHEPCAKTGARAAC